ncbi:hypothetical protein E2C01_022392 [Portunus trituberculatus]|uniref:Uncharacterized protein n=1 Tax=Portunus trituberculatus TaxID=210409 RepID=A0A5B7E579_PORTR|nr:hypothetical protein [Portunus trituberculatus]
MRRPREGADNITRPEKRRSCCDVNKPAASIQYREPPDEHQTSSVSSVDMTKTFTRAMQSEASCDSRVLSEAVSHFSPQTCFI